MLFRWFLDSTSKVSVFQKGLTCFFVQWGVCFCKLVLFGVNFVSINLYFCCLCKGGSLTWFYQDLPCFC